MTKRSIIIGIAAASATTLLLFAIFRPAPISVEISKVQHGDLEEMVEQEGKTRMHDHFVLAAEVAGRLRRIDLHAGDAVRAGETVAWIDPTPIEPRQRAVLEARLNAAISTQLQAHALAARAQAEYDQAAKDLARGKELYQHGIVSKDAFEKANTIETAALKQLHAAESASQAAAFQVEEVRSALLVYTDRSDLPTPVITPVDGRVLRLFEPSEKIVSPGSPILEIGYTPRLEIVADFLTRDAVKIRPGMPARVTDWGGGSSLAARVRTIEPGAFTKISALGVEEQRVNVICDFTSDPQNLEDAYHLELQVILWKGHNVLLVPSSAVFRYGQEWATFVIEKGRAHRMPLRIGHQGEINWEVLSGLNIGDHVIVHPSAAVADGIRVHPIS